MPTRLAVLAASIATLLPLAPRASAQSSFIWDGGGTTSNWADTLPAGLNWAGDLAPDGNDILTFAGSINLIASNNMVGYTGHRILFVGPGDFVLEGNELTLADFGTAAPKIENNSPALQTINLGLTLDSSAAAGNIAEINPVDGSLTFGGTVNLVDVNELRINGNGGNLVTFNAPINGTGSKLVIRENSIVVMEAAHTYTGNTEVRAGDLQFGINGGLATGTSILLGNSATADVAATLTLAAFGGGQSLTNDIVIQAGDGMNRIIRSQNFAGLNILAGNIALDGTAGQNRTLTFETTFGGSLAVLGTISGNNQSVIKNGDGTLILSGINTYSGATFVNGGTLAISADENLGAAGSLLILNGTTLEASASLNLPATRPISIEALGGIFSTPVGTTLTLDAAVVGSGDITKTGTGTLVLASASNSYGATHVNAGTLALGASNVLPATMVEIMGGTLALEDFNDTVGDVHLFTGSITGNSGVLTATAFNFEGGNVSAILAGTNGLSKTGNGTTTLTGANLFTGGVQIQGGVLAINADAALGNAANTVALNGGALSVTTTQTFTRPILLLETTGNALGASAGQTLTVGDNLVGLGGFTKVGAGTVELAGTAAYMFTGELGVTNGVLLLNKPAGTQAIPAVPVNVTSSTNQSSIVRLAAPNQINDAAYFHLSANGAQSATLDLNGFTETLNGFMVSTTSTGLTTGTNGIRTGAGGTLTLNGDIVFNHNRNATGNTGRELLITGTGTYGTSAPNTGTLDFGGQVRTITVTTNHSQANPVATIETVIPNGGIIKEGNGFLSLNANSTFTGGIVINGGRVRTGAQPNSFSGNWTVNAGGTAWLYTIGANGAEATAALGAAGNGFILNGGTLLAAWSSQSDRTITDRPITIGALGGTIEVAGTSYNNFTEAGQHQLRLTNTAGIVTGSSSITKNGNGRLTLNNPSPGFSGAWIVNSGTLEASGGNRLGDGSVTNTVTVNGGNLALSSTNGYAVTLNGGAISNITNLTTSPVVLTNTVTVTAPSHLFLNDFYQDLGVTKGIVISGVLSGSEPLNIEVNRPGTDANNGTVTLQNTANSFTGGFTVGKNLNLLSQSLSGSGSTMGSNKVTLAGGHLQIRDNGAGDNGTLAYGNDVEVIAPTGMLSNGDLAGTAAINVDRSGGANTGNTVALGALTIADGLSLDVLGANGYGVRFGGPAVFNGAATINIPTGTLQLAGGISGGTDLSKTGLGTLIVNAPTGATYSGTTTINGGTVLFNSPDAIGGSGASIIGGNGGAIATGYAMDQALISRVVPSSNLFVFAMAANSSNALDLSAFPLARLGAVGNVTYSGTVTQSATTYRFGGGSPGHVLNLTGTPLTGNRTLDIGSNGSGAGVVAVASTNDFTGTIALSGGELLRAPSNASLGNVANVIMADGGGIQFAAGNPFDIFAVRTINFGAGGFILDTNGNDFTPSAAIGNGAAGGFTKAGAGVLTLNQPTNFTGTTGITGGTLAFDNVAKLGVTGSLNVGGELRFTGALPQSLRKAMALSANGNANLQTVNPGGTLIVDQTVSGGTAAGSVALTVMGAGVTVLNNVANSFTGDIVVDGGILSVAGQGAVEATRLGAGTKTVFLRNGGILRATGNANFDPNPTKTFSIGAGGGTIEIASDAVNTVVGQFDIATQLVGAGALTKAGPGRLVLGAPTVGFSGFSGNVVLAAGQIDVRNAASYGSGNAITVQGGTLRYQQDTAFSFPHSVTITGNSTINVDRVAANAGNTLTVSTLNIGAQTLALTNGNTYKLAIPTINLTGNATFNVGGTTNLFTATGTVNGAGFGFTKTGALPMTLGNGAADTTVNTYTGVTTVNAGTLTLDKQGGLSGSGGAGGGTIVGDNNTATPDVVISGTGTLFLNANEQIANTATLSLDGGILNLNGKTETVHAVNFNGGSIVRGPGGALNIASAAGEVLLFDGDNLGATTATNNIHYVGATTTSTIASLTLSPTPLTISVANGAAADDLTITGVINGAGQTFTKTGTGVLLLSGANTFGGAGVTLKSTGGGSIAYTSENALGDAGNTVVVSGGGLVQPRGLATLTRLPQIGTGGGGFDILASQTVTINGGLTNVPGQSGPLIKNGSGALVLTGTHSFDGGVLALSGILRLTGGTGNGPLGVGPITLAGGTVELRNDASNIYGNHVNPVAAGALVVARATSATNQIITLGDLGQGGTGALSFASTAGYTVNVANVNLPGGFIYGNTAATPDVSNSTLVVAPGGTVALGNGTGIFRIGTKAVTNASGAISSTFDATGAASFVVNGAVFEVGIETASGVGVTTGVMKLPASATITATTNVTVADSASGQGANGSLQMGAGTTTITTPLFVVGGRKGTGTATVAEGGTVVIGNGSSRTQLQVGRNNVSTGVPASGNFDLSSAGAPKTIIASLQSVVVGEKTAGSSGVAGTSQGTLNFGSSAATQVDIFNPAGVALMIGHITAGGAATPNLPIAGTVTFGGGTVNIATTDNALPAVRLGAADGTYGTDLGGHANGTLNLNGGNVFITNFGIGAAIDLTPTHTGSDAANRLATAQLNVAGANVNLVGDITAGAATGAGVWTSGIALTGGTLDLNGNDIGSTTTFAFTGGTLREMASLARPLEQNGATSQFLVTGGNTAITGSYTLTAGSAVIDATRSLSASGGTVIGGGNLLVNGTLSGVLSVSSGTVRGDGTLGAATFVGGILSPGNSPGQMDTGDLNLGAASTLIIELGGTTAGTGYDQLNVTGSLSLAGTLNASFVNGYVADLNTPFYIILNDGIDNVTGGFAGLAEGAPLTIGGVDFNITYKANADGGTIGNDVALVVVPEPTGALLMLGGLAMLLGGRRNRRSVRR